MAVPKIRIKGYTDEWVKKGLTDTVELFGGLTYTPSNIRESGTLVLRSSNVQNGEISLLDNVFVESSVVNSPFVQKGDIIVVVRNGSRALIGKHAHIKEDINNAVIGAFMSGIRHKNSEFINALLDTSNFHSEVDKNLGATINQITNATFRSMIFNFPSDAEQRALGNFFDTLDNQITMQTSRIATLKQTKQASLQSMFPQEGETKPRVRFKGFTDEWKKVLIEDMCKVTTGKSNTQDQVSNGNYPFFIRSEKVARSNRYLHDLEAVITIGDGNIGKVFHYINGKFDLHQRCYMIYNFNTSLYAKYFYYYFTTYFYARVIKMSAKATVDSVRLDMITKMEILIPSFEEQKQIAEYFSNLDKQISIQEQRLEKLKQIKSACLKNMFV